MWGERGSREDSGSTKGRSDDLFDERSRKAWGNKWVGKATGCWCFLWGDWEWDMKHTGNTQETVGGKVKTERKHPNWRKKTESMGQPTRKGEWKVRPKSKRGLEKGESHRNLFSQIQDQFTAWCIARVWGMRSLFLSLAVRWGTLSLAGFFPATADGSAWIIFFCIAARIICGNCSREL